MVDPVSSCNGPADAGQRPSAKDIAHALDGIKSGDGWKARCPAHNDANPSLSVSEGANGKVLFNCKAGCTQEAVIDELRRLNLWGNRGNGSQPRARKPNSADRNALGERIASFDYKARDGKHLYYVDKYEPKDFRRRPAGGANVLYRWPELVAAGPDATLFVCEGEKDADRVAALGYIATTVAHGSWKGVDVSDVEDRDVIILEDADEPGVKKALATAQALRGVAKTIRIVRLPGHEYTAEKHGKDVSDWLDEDESRTADALADASFAVPVWSGDEPQTDLAPAFSEEAIAIDFANRHAKDLRYVARWNQWFCWDGTCWREDQTRKVFSIARGLCRELALTVNKPNESKRVASAKTRAAVVSLAGEDYRLAATTDQWDADPWLLNTPDGAIDLRTGKMRQHRVEDYATKQTAVAPAGDCPQWKEFMGRITGGDEALQRFLQRWCGYALTGSTREHAMGFGFGVGANGKSVFTNTITGVLADYATTAPIETFTVTNTEQHPTELARLRGARLVVATETEEGRRWAESKIKMLTGGDRTAARFMRQDFFEFTPQFKLWIVGNHKPGLRSVNEAIRRRFLLVPFDVVIPPAERDADLAGKLKDEWPGILQWMVDGALAWQRDGLAAPAAVANATEAYLEGEDAIALWLEECTVPDVDAWANSSDLFRSWKEWSEAAGEYTGNQRRFSQNLETKGLIPERRMLGRGYRGRKLRESWELGRRGLV
jgi:putative DNA primase/helicase